MVSGKIKTYFLGIVSLLVVGGTLFPVVIAYAANTTSIEQDLDRRRLVAFRTCLSDQHLDESDEGGNVAEDFNDLWDGSDGAGYHDEKVVVGFDIDSGNGVQSCKTVISAGLRILETSVTSATQAEKKLLELLIGKSEIGGNVSGGTLRSNRDKLVDRINTKLGQIGEQTRQAFTVSRLAPLIKMCFDIKEDSPSLTTSSQNFRMSIGGTTYYMQHKTNIDDDSFSFLDQQSANNNVKIGDIELGFGSGNDGMVGAGNWSSWESDFYPFGSDLPNFTGDHVGNGGIIDCKFIKDKKDFFSKDSVLSVDLASDTIATCLDKNGNGACEQDEALQSSIDPVTGDTLSANGDDRPSCETTGGNVLSWALCPMINGAAAIADWILETFIVPFLENVPISSNSDTNKGSTAIFEVWSSFRVIANILLIGLLMAIAIAQGASKS